MQALLRKIRQILKDRRTRKFFTRFVASVAAIVVFVTTYALILPAITLEKTAACGIEEHQHSDSCYEERLVCGQEESDGHHHAEGCYSVTRELVCEEQEHQHSSENGCYDADGNLMCELQEHVHDDSCHEEVRTLTCGLKESEGHHHTDDCYEKVLVCGKEVHTHSEKCYEEGGSTDADTGADAGNTSDGMPSDQSDTGETAPAVYVPDATTEETQPDSYVPELDPLDMEAVLNGHTDFYYFHAEEGEEVPADSAEITEWKKVGDGTKLESTDLVKAYFAYTIPAGSLNETNATARYRMPGNLHLSDEQIDAMNRYENGIAAGYRDSDTSSGNYQKYLGAEAVEGDRRPDEQPGNGAQEYISAVVRAENVYGDNGQYLGQDLIFTFVPYSIEKNRNTYDADQILVSAGEKITGWFACDFRLDQIDWESETETANASIENTENAAGENITEENQTAKVIFAEEDQMEGIKEISRTLRLSGQDTNGESDEAQAETSEDTGEDSEDENDQIFESGTLTAEGDDYKIILDYSEEAKIPENASLSVREITAETDKEAYETCLAQAGQQVAADDQTSVDQKASRFFDIEILATETDSDGTEKTVKIEPAAPVSVNIQINDMSAVQENKSEQSEPTVLHFAEEGVEQIDSTASTDSAKGNDSEGTNTEISFEAESFSIYGVVYTVDFHYENGDGDETKSFDFSINGGNSVTLSELVEVLGILDGTKYENIEAFLDAVEDVRFSDDSLVSVTKDGNDWILTSLQSFTSNEELTITMNDGQVFTVLVTDPPGGPSNESSNLNDFLNKVTVSGASVVDGKYVVEEGKTYTVALTFKETPQHQFDNDGTLTYTLPEGVTIPSGTTNTIKIAIVSGGKTYEIPATVTVNTDGTVTVEFDKTDPNYFRLADSTNVGFRVTIDAQFTENVLKTEWGARAERDIVLDTTDTSDAYVTKSAVFDETTGTFTYTVKVTASGAPENVNVKDVISGNALIFNNDVRVTGNNSPYTTKAVSNGFDYTFTSMQDGEEITITYTASVDPSKASNGTISADQTKNTATVQKEGGDPHTAEYSHAIDLTSISKSDGTAAGSTADGNKIYAWTIDYNPMAMVSVAGDTITDTIGSASQAYMSYYGNVTVKVYNASGTLVDTRTVTPGTSSWNYTIPSSDTAAYHYVFEYQTVVDQSAVNQTGNSLQLTNEVSGGGKTDGGTVNVAPAEKTTITKAVESSSSTEVTWVSNIHVPESGLNTAVVTDTLPNIYSGNIGLDGNYMLYDAYKDGTLEITGLLSGESYDVTTSDDKVVITFYKDSGKTQTGLQGTTGGHDITIRLTTSVNQDWLQYGYKNPSGWQASHKNEISINGTKADASVTFAKPGISKSGSQETDGQGNTYFLYTIVLSGVSESPIMIEDTFDTKLLEVATDKASLWYYFKIWGGNQYSQDDGITSVNYSDTENGILITANDVPLQSNGEYYPYYKISYILKLKDGVDLEDLAIENGGSYELTNMAFWGDHSASYTFTTTYDFLDKELLKEASSKDRQVQYRITYNPAKAELNGGKDLVMTDTLNANLSVDYSSISISTDPEGVEVPYTLSGNDAGETIAKYTIPDSTKVVITYNAMVVGNGSVNYKNVVEANGVTETVERTTSINIEGEGDGATADLSVVKVDGYDANKKLSGVQFKLYSADLTESGEQYDLSLDHSGVYEKILITDENGVLKIDGTQINIYFGVKYYLEEVAAPEGYQNISFKYQFTLTDDMDHVDYAHYVYFYSDSFQIKNWPLEGLVVGKSVESDDESDHTKEFTFEVSILTESGDVDTSVNETYGDMTFVSGVATIKLKDTEQASAWNMPSGTKFKVEEKDAEGYTVSTTVGDTTKEGSSYTGETGVDYTLVTFTNKKEDQTGSLKLTKVVHVDDQTPATDAEKTLVNGDYVFTVSSDNSIIKYVQITVTDGAPASYKIADTQAALESATSQTGTSALISGLAEGDYVITEIEKNGMTLKEAVRGDGDTDAVSSGKAVTVHVTAGQNEPADTSAAAATFTNNIETVTAKVAKVWNHSGNTGTTPTSLTVTLSSGVTKELNGDNNWTAEVTDLPKYDRTTGNLIEYSWTEAELPAGYYLSNIQETTDMATGVITTTLTNSYTDHYNPTTTITGKKVWDDGGEGRPASITVNLYKDGGTTPYRTITVQAPTGEEANQDEWPFEFTNLPVFNSDGSVVQYTVEEVLPAGYTDEYGIKIEFEQATYIAGDATGTIVNSGQGSQTFKITEGFNLGYIVIRHGNDFIIWTQRPATDDEISAIKTKVVGLSDQFNGISSATGSSMKIVSGVPGTVDVGKKHAVSVYMQNGEVWMKFLNPNAWSDFAYGTIPYTYTQAGGEGGGTITNTKKNTDIEFGKQWINISQQEIEWDQDIQVTVSRNKGDGTKDAAFSLAYNIAKTSVNGATGGTAEFSTGTETDPKLKLTITTESGTKKYSFKIENLAYSRETDGKYTYYVEETNSQLTGYLAPSYTNTSAPTGATAAYDGGTIINKQEGGYVLPSTGGPGTRLFTVLGSILILGAGVLLWRRRRTI